MNVENLWKIVKNRYCLSTKTQMNFELSFPRYVIAKCRFTTETACQIRTQKVSPSLKGIIFSDTIPLSWFTSSALIPWEKLLELTITDTAPSIEGILNTPVSSDSDRQSPAFQSGTLKIDDPVKMTIEVPWSKALTQYVQENTLFDI